MSVESMILAGRARIEDTFIDQCTISRPSHGAPALDETTGITTPAATTVVYTGRCRVKKPTQVEREQTWGDTDVNSVRRLINLPYDVAEIRKDDVVAITASLDDEMLRQHLRVTAIVARSINTHRQVGVEVIE